MTYLRKHDREGSPSMRQKARRDQLGRFKRGVSGNPAGRSRNVERRYHFVDAYIATFYCGARAARLVGCPPAGARVAAHRMLREPDVVAALDDHFKALAKKRLLR